MLMAIMLPSFAVSLFPAICDYFRWLPQYRINHNYPTKTEITNLLYYLTINTTYTIVMTYIGYDKAIELCNMKTDVKDIPSLYISIIYLLLILFIDDFCFYWIHRLWHTKRFYVYTHKAHHQFQYPFAFTQYGITLFELLGNSVGSYVCMIFLQPHFFLLMFYMVFRVADGALEHHGYVFPWERGIKKMTLGLQGGGLNHNYHHRTSHGNYGSILSVWDKLFGTYVEGGFVVNK